MEAELLSFAVHEKIVIRSLVVILCTSTLVALLFQRLRVALIPAYLIAGVLIGPSGLALVQSSGVVEEIGHLAVVLLLFGIGMELHLSAIRKDATTLLGTSLASCLLSILVIFSFGQVFGLSWPKALVIGMGFSLSSTALVLRLLSNTRELTRGHGQLSLAILVTQDLLVLFMLAAIPTLASWVHPTLESTPDGITSNFTLWGSLTTAGFVLTLFVAGQKLLPRLLSESLHSRSTEILMLTAVSSALLAAYITQKLGFSLEMGAFLIGFLLASSPFRHQLAGQVAPLRDLFMAIFFTVLGMNVDLAVVTSEVAIIGLGTIVLLGVKALCIFSAAWLFGVHNRIAILAALILAQAGEFSLIVLDVASDYRIFTPEEISIAIGIVVLSLILTPLLFSLSKILASYSDHLPANPWTSGASLQTSEEQLLSASGEHVIIAGYGPVGRAVAKNLTEIGVPFTVVELNSTTVKREKEAGVNIMFGDIANEGVLDAVEIRGARALVISFSDPVVAIDASSKARLLNPSLEIVARANSLVEQRKLECSEINHAVVDEESSALIMVELSNRYMPIPSSGSGSS